MPLPRQLQKDHVAGALLVALGLAVLIAGMGYHVGSLVRMGPGYIPVVLGTILTVVGVAVALLTDKGDATGSRHALPPLPDLRGTLCILAGLAAFVLFGTYGGLLPASFAAVFIAALGDRQNTPKSAALLGAAMVVFGLVVFHWGLRLQLPLFTWG